MYTANISNVKSSVIQVTMDQGLMVKIRCPRAFFLANPGRAGPQHIDPYVDALCFLLPRPGFAKKLNALSSGYKHLM